MPRLRGRSTYFISFRASRAGATLEVRTGCPHRKYAVAVGGAAAASCDARDVMAVMIFYCLITFSRWSSTV